MTDESTAEAWLESLQENLERDLIQTGYISAATREFWTLVGYDDPANPEYQTSRDYVHAISKRLRLPPTNDLNELEQEYQKRRYTRRCLQFGLSVGQCLIGASEYGHQDVISAILPLLNPNDDVAVQNAVLNAIQADRLDIVKILDPYVIMALDPNDPEYNYRVEDVYDYITEEAAIFGRLEILKHELDYAARVYNYTSSARLYMTAGDIPTLEYTLNTYTASAIEDYDEIVDAAIEDGKIWKIRYLQAWSQTGRDGLAPVTTKTILQRAVYFDRPDVFAAFAENWAPGWTFNPANP